jgi:hypothetical protein
MPRINSLNSLALIATLLLISGGCSGNQEAASKNAASVSPEGVFPYRDTRSELVDIFDFNRNIGVVGGRELLLDPGNASSEFSGPIDSCGDPEFFCLATGLHIAIPRSGVLSRWATSGLSCEADRTADPDTFSAICRVEGHDISVRFLYSMRRGIISYSRICNACRPQEYILVGDKGMFARDPRQ